MLTKRQREILTIMRDHRDDYEGELVYERGHAYLGDDRIAARTVFALLRKMVIHMEEGSGPIGKGLERYRINETGIKMLEEDNEEPRYS